MKTILGVVLIVLGVLGIGVWLFNSSNNANPADLPGQLYENLGAEHIPQGTTDHPAYNSNPPTSGWHWPQPANWGVYDATLPDEQLVHNLEHGGIWIAYKPDLDSGVVNQLKDFARRYRKVIVEPRAANDTNIAVAAWTRLMKLDNYSETDIIRFIEAHYDQGPEKVD